MVWKTSVTITRAKTSKEQVMNVSYHIRTIRGAPVFSFDSLQRAKEERFRAEKRIGCKMQIVKVTRLEEVVE